MAKSLGGGMPIAAVTGSRGNHGDGPGPGALGGNLLRGTPASCAAALAAIETIEKEGLRSPGPPPWESILNWRARGWQKKWPLVRRRSRPGAACCAIELVRDPPDAGARRFPRPRKLRSIAYEHGLIIHHHPAGTFQQCDSHSRAAHCDQRAVRPRGLNVIEAALASVAERKQGRASPHA